MLPGPDPTGPAVPLTAVAALVSHPGREGRAAARKGTSVAPDEWERAGPGAVRVERVTWADAEEALRAVREAVFIDEQRVPVALEWDEHDAPAVHLLARGPGGLPIGTARLLAEGETLRFGRMAVLAAWRGRGVGRALMASLLDLAAARGAARVVLDAQLHAIPFYERFGFRAHGGVFDDAGIPHRAMSAALPPARSCHDDAAHGVVSGEATAREDGRCRTSGTSS